MWTIKKAEEMCESQRGNTCIEKTVTEALEENAATTELQSETLRKLRFAKGAESVRQNRGKFANHCK